MEIHCLHPCPDATGVTTEVSLPRYWCSLLRNRQIHEDKGILLFADHIRALTETLVSKLADVGKPLVWQLGRYADRGLTPSPDLKAKRGRGQEASRGHRPRWPNWLNEPRLVFISRAPIGYPEVFRDFPQL